MSKNKYRLPVLILAFLLLIAGAILQYKQLTIAWFFVGVAIILYLMARIFMRDKKKENPSSDSSR